MKRNKSWEHIASKKRDRNSDAYKLDDIQQHLTQQGWIVHRETQISNGNFTTRNKLRVPDLKVTKGKFECYIELDGRVHQDLMNQTKNTIERNSDYEKANMNYIIISEDDAKHHNLNVLDLTSYCLSERYSKFVARLNAGCLII